MNSIPDATILAFLKERLRRAGLLEELFQMFEGYLEIRASKPEADKSLMPLLFLTHNSGTREKKTKT